MMSLARLKVRPCLIMAMELLGIHEPSAPQSRILRAIDLVDGHLGDSRIGARKAEKIYDSRLLVAGHRALYFAPIQASGKLPFSLLLNVLHLQLSLVEHGILLRGAMTLGDAIGREDIAVGAGIIEAERLRDELADVPRVIVAPRLMREVEHDPRLRAHSVPSELGYIRGLLREDADGLWFIDYLGASSTEMDEPSDYLAFLQDHRRLVERRLEGTTQLDRASRSWTWLRSYHNLIVDSPRIEEAERSRLHVPATSPLVYAFPLAALKP